jgi:hypothetical protein
MPPATVPTGYVLTMNDTSDNTQRSSKEDTPTPRTDEVVADGWSGDVYLVPYEFAQKLERENEGLREQLGDWLKANGPGGWIDDLRKRSTAETRCVHPLGALFHHGFVSGKLHDYRCNLCNKVVNIPGLDSRIWAAARIDFQEANALKASEGQS